MFDAIAAVTPQRPDIVAAFRREWTRLAEAGATLTGAQRGEVAAAARAGQAGEAPQVNSLPRELIAFVELLAADPTAVAATTVAQLGSEMGFGPVVEAIGVTARLAGVDGFHRSMGIPLEDLPTAQPGEPNGDLAPEPLVGNGWVPKARMGSIVDALSLVPAEAVAQEDLHGPLYLTYEQMGDRRFVRGLNRAQLELLACRTSSINECFY